MTLRILLCSDLDRTILPNGPQEEAPQARPLLRALAARPEVTIAYVSGRHKELLLEAIDTYNIPVPHYAIADVGTTIYRIENNTWRPWQAWQEEIAPDWRGRTGGELAGLFRGIAGLTLQEAEKQNSYKLSYYVPETADFRQLINLMGQRLAAENIRANLIRSIDEMAHIGLLDVLPRSANKLHAIRFLMARQNFSATRTVFAGDSGNDLDVLASGLQSVLVRNATPEVREEALQRTATTGARETLYCAQGNFLGLNGNYAAGVLEGLAHFIPAVIPWLRAGPGKT